MRTSSTRTCIVITICVFAVLLGVVLSFSWKEIYAEVPSFEQLQVAQANGFRADIAREVYSPTQYSLELHDSTGTRYQVRGMEKAERDQIAAALSANDPVTIRYGKWSALFPSARIFTVYQVEVGPQVIVPYERLANARHREQSAGPMIMLGTVLMTGLAVFLGVRTQRRFQQQLASARSRNSDDRPEAEQVNALR